MSVAEKYRLEGKLEGKLEGVSRVAELLDAGYSTEDALKIAKEEFMEE